MFVCRWPGECGNCPAGNDLTQVTLQLLLPNVVHKGAAEQRTFSFPLGGLVWGGGGVAGAISPQEPETPGKHPNAKPPISASLDLHKRGQKNSQNKTNR